MKLNEVSEEVKAQLYGAGTVDDFIKVCEENGVEVTRETAEKFYNTHDFSQKRKLSDDELSVVVGGERDYLLCNHCNHKYYRGDAEMKQGSDGCGSTYLYYKCPKCGEWN